MRRRVGLRELGFWYALGVLILKPFTLAFTRPSWTGLDHVPRTGGVVLAVNHISYADPPAVADCVVFGVGRPGRFLVKSSMFVGGGIVARVLRGARQIPVHRQTADAADALDAAVVALQDGECVVIYPEGTVTQDPGIWPMLAKTGVARLALQSGTPVVPMAQWGAQAMLDPRRKKRIRLLPPTRVQVAFGPPVDLSAFRGRELTVEVLRGATDAVMADITVLLAGLRGEPAPPQVLDPRQPVPAADEGRRTA